MPALPATTKLRNRPIFLLVKEKDLYWLTDPQWLSAVVFQVGDEPKPFLKFDNHGHSRAIEPWLLRIMDDGVGVELATATQLGYFPIKGMAERARRTGGMPQLRARCAPLRQQPVLPCPLPEELAVPVDGWAKTPGRRKIAQLQFPFQLSAATDRVCLRRTM